MFSISLRYLWGKRHTQLLGDVHALYHNGDVHTRTRTHQRQAEPQFCVEVIGLNSNPCEDLTGPLRRFSINIHPFLPSPGTIIGNDGTAPQPGRKKEARGQSHTALMLETMRSTSELFGNATNTHATFLISTTKHCEQPYSHLINPPLEDSSFIQFKAQWGKKAETTDDRAHFPCSL